MNINEVTFKACTMKLYDILKVKKALVQSVLRHLVYSIMYY